VAGNSHGLSDNLPSGASLDSDRLFEMALEQSGMVSNSHFRRWQDTNQLSLTQAAQAIGLTRRTINLYPVLFLWREKVGK
jgi:hypothetical protein